MAAHPINRATVSKTFLALVLLTILLRIFYAAHLFEDDGLWFTAAEELLGGKALYREIFFDKPPALPLLYALLFKLFGAHLLVIRVFTILYSLAISALLYRIGARLYDRREGLLAAVFFTIFSTTYSTGHMQGLNTDFLMALPYTASVYFFIRAKLSAEKSALFTFAGGVLAGLSFQINPKGAFALLFCTALFILFRTKSTKTSILPISESKPHPRIPSSLHPFIAPFLPFAIALAGFVIASLPFFVYVIATNSWQAYWVNVWAWGSRYAGYFPLMTGVGNAVRLTASYLALNNTLLVALIVFIWQAGKRNQEREPVATVNPSGEPSWQPADKAVLLWLLVSYIGVVLGGRLYGHYFFQTLPALCLIGAHGLSQLLAVLRSTFSNRMWLRASLAALLLIGFGFTMARFHSRTVALATDWIHGQQSETTKNWYHEQLNREEQIVASFVRDLRDPSGNPSYVFDESLRRDSPRRRGSNSSADFLFVWGYRPELYYWSGLLPASRYLSSQPLTGVPADVHFFGWDYRSILEESITAEARAQLLRDLEATPPRYIVDELAVFNSRLAMRNFPELKEFLRRYKRVGKVERFIIYRQKNVAKKLLKQQKKRERKARQPAASR